MATPENLRPPVAERWAEEIKHLGLVLAIDDDKQRTGAGV
jgi:hypothetical protein